MNLIISIGFCPDDEHIRDRRIGDPHLAALQNPAAVHFFGAGLHAAGVTAVIGFGQAETADPLPAGKFDKYFLRCSSDP